MHLGRNITYEYLLSQSVNVLSNFKCYMFHFKGIGTEKHMWTSGSYRYEHIDTCRRQEFQNIFERKLCSCFGELLLVY